MELERKKRFSDRPLNRRLAQTSSRLDAGLERMQVNIIVSSAGRRVDLMNCFRESLSELGIAGRIIALDATPYSAAAQLADDFYLMPRCTDPNFIAEVQQICEKEEVHLVVPTLDTELPAYAAAREGFRNQGTEIAISSPETVAICYNKILTHEWLVAKGLPVPRQATPHVVLENPRDWTLPLIVERIDGNGSLGVHAVTSFEELAALVSKSNGTIVREYIEGAEHTINVFVNHQGRCLCAVPQFRMEIRGGEVSKGVTVKNREMIELANTIVENMPGAYGALNVQCFSTASGDLKVIEINARFGGGYPLAHRAGAPITRWLIEEILGREPQEPVESWEDGLTMLRYDEAVFVPRSTLQTDDHYAASAHRVRS
jgi:carbamoyl-phosphate synthase large subunit